MPSRKQVISNRRNVNLRSQKLNIWELLLEMDKYAWTQSKPLEFLNGQPRNANVMFNHSLDFAISTDVLFTTLLILLDHLTILPETFLSHGLKTAKHHSTNSNHSLPLALSYQWLILKTNSDSKPMLRNTP